MKQNYNNGQNSVATSALYHFDCATNFEERGVVYDDMTSEKLSTWFKVTKNHFPIRVMEQKDFIGFISKDKETGEYSLMVYHMDWRDSIVRDKWNLRIGKTITKKKWEAITKFIGEYLDGDLEKNYAFSKEHRLALA